MSGVAQGIKILLLSLVIMALAFALLSFNQELWQPQQAFIEKISYGLLVFTALFAAYFNQTRLTLLIALWLLLSLSTQLGLPWSAWLSQQGDWLFLFGQCLLVLLALLKDRSLFSYHLYPRIALIVGIGVIAWLWLIGAQLLLPLLTKAGADGAWLITFAHQHFQALVLGLPSLFSLAFLCYRYLRTRSLFFSSLVITAVFWSSHYFAWLALPLQISLTLLSSYYLCIVVIDSYFLAYRDELTALPSRRALFQHILSLGRKYHVAMLDIDHFKKFNDTYGHDIGDQVLKLVATKIATVTNGGKAFRYGGEEFTIVFARKNQATVYAALDAVRLAIESYPIVIRQPQRATKEARGKAKRDNLKTVQVTISIGFAERGKKQSFEQVLKKADQALYRAKKKGRNNVSE